MSEDKEEYFAVDAKGAGGDGRDDKDDTDATTAGANIDENTSGGVVDSVACSILPLQQVGGGGQMKKQKFSCDVPVPSANLEFQIV